MARARARAWLILVGIPAVVVVAAAAFLAWRQSVPAVRAEFTPAPRFLGVRTPLTLVLRAARGGVAGVEVRVVQGQGRVTVLRQDFPGGAAEERLPLTVEGGTLGLREGAAIVEVYARDTFWRLLRVDDRPVLALPVTLDLVPPAVEVLAATRYLSQGGGGLVAFRARGATRAGVNVGGIFLPAYPTGAADSSIMVAVIALPWDFPASSAVTVTAQDEAGNTTTRGAPVEIKPRRFPRDTVELSERFFTEKLPELLPGRTIAPGEVLPAFLIVNRDQRREAEQAKREIGAKTQAQPLWEGPFLQPRNTKVFSNFAETRSYRYQGQEVDVQVHLGYDLASVKNSPVPAANAGSVVFAAPLTIYGNTVVVDHGLGLMTLYGHLSTMEVKEGDRVAKGQTLGRTGTTGLALGDHLHYEVLIHGIPVTPLEWWDAKWIRDHIGQPLREAGVSLLKGEQPAAAGETPPAAARPRPLDRIR